MFIINQSPQCIFISKLSVLPWFIHVTFKMSDKDILSIREYISINYLHVLSLIS